MRILGLRPAAAAAMLFVLLPDQASAGLFDFGASYQRQAVTGRHLVAFPPGYEPGTVIVQFNQRRLYLVLPQQRAISYPIGAPTDDARWSGETYVSEKRVNPGWTPTPEMRRENPDLPAHVPGGHPRNPLGVRAMYLGKTLYHPRDRFALDGRAGGLSWLYPGCSIRTLPTSIKECPLAPPLL